jgi:glycerophosphoryl diester phosphodiesterase
VIAHRGASGHAPENTIAAFDLALAQGADVLEVDVRLFGDGELLTLHDPTLDRTTGGRRDHPAAPAAFEAVLDRYGADARFLVDLKEPAPAWEGRVVEAIERRGIGRRTMVQSFDLEALERLHRAAPWLAIAALYGREASVGLDAGAIPPFARAVGIHHPNVDADFVAAAQERGLAVHPWTVDDVAEAERLLALGVDALITNVPDVVRALVDAGGPVPAAA